MADRDIEGAISRGTAGSLLDVIRARETTTRAELGNLTGLARSTIAARVEQLLADNLVVEMGEARSTGGRPPSLLAFNKDAGVVLVADLGATHSRLAVCDLAANPLASVPADRDISDGPEAILSWAEDTFAELLAGVGKTEADVRGVGIGVPGPVHFASGRAVHPPIMPGWDGYAIRDRMTDRYGAPALVDNDVNIMALGERAALPAPVDDFIFVKVGTGIGSGLILGGRIHRGADGTAGDLGHIEAGESTVRCRCGNIGCLEASAGGAALARQLADAGHATANSRDVVRLVRSGDHDAIRAVREAGRLIGHVLASVVNLLNPSMIVVGGDVATSGEQLLAGIREVVYRRSTALSTSGLQIEASVLGDRAGVVGAARMIIDHLLAPSAVDAALTHARVGA